MANGLIEIRRMAAGDLPRVHELDQMCFSLPWPQRTFRYELEENPASSQWVAVRSLDDAGSAQIVGVIVTWLLVDQVHIATLSVDPVHRREKIASKLICTALRDGVGRGAVSATLEVRAKNKAAQCLYIHFGFQLMGRRPGYYQDNGEDAFILTLQKLDNDHLDIIGCKQLEMTAGVN
jgi:ribosomal-protein-alanine N-acetyltransferase